MTDLNFESRFVPKIEQGEKSCTLRSLDKQVCKGDTLRLTEEKNGEREAFLITKCSEVKPVMIRPSSEFYIDGISIDVEDYDRIAREDGFKNYDELFEFIKTVYQLPFHGHLIRWPVPHCWSQGGKNARN